MVTPRPSRLRSRNAAAVRPYEVRMSRPVEKRSRSAPRMPRGSRVRSRNAAPVRPYARPYARPHARTPQSNLEVAGSRRKAEFHT